MLNIPFHFFLVLGGGSFNFWRVGWLQSKGNYKKSSSDRCFWGGALEPGWVSSGYDHFRAFKCFLLNSELYISFVIRRS